MGLTRTDQINVKISADGEIGNSEILKELILEDSISAAKQRMVDGERYYAGEHDILKKRFDENIISESYAGEAGEERERRVAFRNPNRSNHHNINAFHKILVDQKASYILGREPSVWVRGAENDSHLREFESKIAEFCNEYFNQTLQELVIGASNKGFEAVHFYYDEAGRLCYCVVPATELIPIYDTKHQNKIEQMIRYYDIVCVEHGKKKIRKKVEWWTKTDVTYYTESEAHTFTLDTASSQNPAPHFWEVDQGAGQEKREAHNWGQVPFILLKNNLKGSNDLDQIKGLIDAYDIISSEGTNNFIDLVDLYWVIEGYGAETASAVARKLKINKAVHVLDSSGKVEAKQVELPVAGRLEFLRMLKTDIFLFGQGIDSDAEKFGTAPSGVSLKFRYLHLDLKAGAMITRLKAVIKEMLHYFTEDLNRRQGTCFDATKIEVTINKTMITNDLETVTMVNLSKDLISKKTLLAKHPFIDDINAEMENLPPEETGIEKMQTEKMQTEKIKA